MSPAPLRSGLGSRRHFTDKTQCKVKEKLRKTGSPEADMFENHRVFFSGSATFRPPSGEVSPEGPPQVADNYTGCRMSPAPLRSSLADNRHFTDKTQRKVKQKLREKTSEAKMLQNHRVVSVKVPRGDATLEV